MSTTPYVLTGKTHLYKSKQIKHLTSQKNDETVYIISLLFLLFESDLYWYKKKKIAINIVFQNPRMLVHHTSTQTRGEEKPFHSSTEKLQPQPSHCCHDNQWPEPINVMTTGIPPNIPLHRHDLSIMAAYSKLYKNNKHRQEGEMCDADLSLRRKKTGRNKDFTRKKNSLEEKILNWQLALLKCLSEPTGFKEQSYRVNSMNQSPSSGLNCHIWINLRWINPSLDNDVTLHTDSIYTFFFFFTLREFNLDKP